MSPGPAGLVVFGVLATLAGAVVAVRRRFVTVTVVGPSMVPAYRHGDRILVRRTRVERLRTGQVVVVEHPRPDRRWHPFHGAGPARWMIKRVAALPGDPVPAHAVPALARSHTDAVPPRMLVLLGDNPDSSYDSRELGYIPADRLLGVAIRKLPGVAA